MPGLICRRKERTASCWVATSVILSPIHITSPPPVNAKHNELLGGQYYEYELIPFTPISYNWWEAGAAETRWWIGANAELRTKRNADIPAKCCLFMECNQPAKFRNTTVNKSNNIEPHVMSTRTTGNPPALDARWEGVGSGGDNNR